MLSRLSARVQTLSSLLGPAHALSVPSYQRPYAWKGEAGQLLDDILLSFAADADRPGNEEGYFIGNMLLMPTVAGIAPESFAVVNGTASLSPDHAADGLSSTFDIVDGQQRLVTLTILLAVLRDLAAERGTQIGLDVDALLHSGGDDGGKLRPRLRLREIDQPFFERFVLTPGASMLMPDNDAEESQRLILDVREHFLAELADKSGPEIARLALYICQNCSAVVIVTTGLDRAHRLFEVLNNRGKPLARKDILKAHILGLVPPEVRGAYTDRWHEMETRLGGRFDELFSHLRAIDGRSRDRIVEGIEDAVAMAGGGMKYLDEVIVPYARILADIRDARGPSLAVRRALGYLGWLGSADWVPPAMLYWRLADGDVPRLEAFIARLERLAFSLRLLGIGADKRQTRFNQLLAAVREGRADRPDSPLELGREEMRNIIYNLKNLHARSQLTCKLLLLRVNDELAGSPQGLDPQAYTVEHVLPQRPARGSVWRRWFPSPEARESATQSLGNLVLVTREQNDRARNLELAKKLGAYFAPGSGVVPFITAELAGKEQWTPEDVAAREARILDAVDRLWRLDAARGAAATGGADANEPGRQRARRVDAGAP